MQQDSVVIRPLEEDDRVEVAGLVGRSLEALAASPSVAQWGGGMRQGFLRLHHPADGRSQAVLVADTGGSIPGLAVVTVGGRHPDHPFLRITVDPARRRGGIGRALLGAVRRSHPGPFVVREMQADGGSIAFYETMGFEEAERATEGLIDPTAPTTREWIEANPPPPGVTVTEADEGNARQVALLLDRLYRWTHAWAPPPPLSPEKAVDAYLRSSDPALTMAAHRGSDLVGAGTLSKSPFTDDPGRAHLVWVGVPEADHPDAYALTGALVAACLDAARDAGLLVEIEASTAHHHLHRLVNQIPGASLFEDLTMLVGR